MAEYSMISVPRKNNNAGRASGKMYYIIIFRWDDVKTFAKDEKGVRVTDFAFREGKKPVAVCATESTINIYHSEVEWDEFVNNNVNENLGAIVFNCKGDDCKIAGTPCTPLKMSTAEGQDNNEANKTTVNLASSLRGDTLGRIAKSLIPMTDNEEINAILGLPAAAESSQGGGV